MTASKARNAHLRSCVVLVDDEPSIRETIGFILDAEGIEVATAPDGVEGLSKIRNLRPKVVLLDVMMPRMDGYEVCRAIRQDANLLGTYVIILTAKGQKSDEAKAIEVGADLYLSKPFDDEVVLKVIREVFDGLPFAN
ncbi:MAG: response regulator [Deltaproteobacteria bacterium]|nr:response regulator [Deltaproteobacteria bacterium]